MLTSVVSQKHTKPIVYSLATIILMFCHYLTLPVLWHSNCLLQLYNLTQSSLYSQRFNLPLLNSANGSFNLAN